MYKPAQFSYESGGNEVYLGMYLFDCLTAGVTWNFEYAPNVIQAPSLYQQYDNLVNFDFYAKFQFKTQHFFFQCGKSLDKNWTVYANTSQLFNRGPFEGYPLLLAEVVQAIRGFMAFDVINEFQMTDGILQKFQYNHIIWVGTTIARNSTLQQMMSFVNQGGVLAVFDLTQIQIFETGALWWTDTTHLPDPNHFNAISIGKGWVYNAGGNINNLIPFCVFQFRGLPLQTALGPLPGAPVVNGVYFSFYPSGILLFNSLGSVVNTSVTISNSNNLRVNYTTMPPGFTTSITLQPYQMILFNGTQAGTTGTGSTSGGTTALGTGTTMTGGTTALGAGTGTTTTGGTTALGPGTTTTGGTTALGTGTTTTGGTTALGTGTTTTGGTTAPGSGTVGLGTTTSIASLLTKNNTIVITLFTLMLFVLY